MVAQGAPVFGHVGDAQAVEVLPGIIRRMVAVSERMMIVHWTFAAGTTVPLHTHPHEQVGTVISGRIRMTIGESAAECGLGDTWTVPSMVPHAATAIEPSVVVDVFSPPREEYLPK